MPTSTVQTIPGASLAIDRKARANVPASIQNTRPVSVRILDFNDVVIPMEPEDAMLEAARCVHCPDPAPCVVACPAHNDIPSAMWLIEQGRYVEAAQLYRETSSLPEICSRVCPHEQLCQGSCTLQKSLATIQTGALEAFVTSYARELAGTTIPVGEPTGKRVAIVGAGPAGLSCADQLVQMGHQVVVFESKPTGGGLLVYGIPNFKLPKEIVSAKISDLERVGVEFVYNAYIGQTRTIDDLFNDGFEAVFVGVGTLIDSPMDVPGEELPGVYKATEFLMRANTPLEQLPPELRSRPQVGKKIAVIGGGDTASDCLRTAPRMGAEQVICLYRRTEREMPGGRHDRELAKEEGAQYQFLTQPVKFHPGEDGRVAQAECIRMVLGEPDAKGRRKPVPVEGSNFIVEVDTVVKALGYWPDPIIGKTTPGLETHDWGLITVKDKTTGATTRPGVFAGGDDVTGPDMVVTAMVAGRKAAAGIDNYLKEKK